MFYGYLNIIHRILLHEKCPLYEARWGEGNIKNGVIILFITRNGQNSVTYPIQSIFLYRTEAF